MKMICNKASVCDLAAINDCHHAEPHAEIKKGSRNCAHGYCAPDDCTEFKDAECIEYFPTNKNEKVVVK